ncbi:MAG TPA: TolB family protein, partial [Xylella taiwanensis]
MKFRCALLLCLLPALAAARGFDVRDMVALDRVSSPELSPDGTVLLFAKRQMDAKHIKASTSVWVKRLHADATVDPVRLTPLGWDVSAPAFSRDGKDVYFLSAKSGTHQLYVLPVSGGTPRQLTNLAVGMDSYKLSPQGDRVVFSAGVFQVCGADLGCTKRKLDEKKNAKASGVVFEQLFVP